MATLPGLADLWIFRKKQVSGGKKDVRKGSAHISRRVASKDLQTFENFGFKPTETSEGARPVSPVFVGATRIRTDRLLDLPVAVTGRPRCSSRPVHHKSTGILPFSATDRGC